METQNYRIIKINREAASEEEDKIIVEYPLTLFINGVEFITLLCTPRSLKELVVGFLYSEGIISSKDDLEDIRINEASGRADVYTGNKDLYYYQGDRLNAKRTVTTACGRQKSIIYNVVDLLGTESDKIHSCVDYTADEILDLANRFNKKSELFITTGGVHSCALCDKKDFIIFEEDIGRHNALDKILGGALLRDIRLEDKMIITSGRISSEMIIKVVKSKIPVLVSRSAPTNVAVDMARKYNLRLMGFARGNRMNVYSGAPEQSLKPPVTQDGG
ncbi:MAG: formate dehydrogenase accessory sulfurtransferase FdhD [Clostridiales bacterium]|jgi:FdhD protein|nr:formate dehydrogenase accessory sulfurtransferase FdhD [Eubacteriales bacterium]MDH7566478.1 formate dehydrogenase accessory sulfurtransferase FdhD [Clostridiales bacterium]